MKQYSCSTASGAIKALEGCLAVAVNHVMAAPVSPAAPLLTSFQRTTTKTCSLKL